jgi:hypothetical protein
MAMEGFSRLLHRSTTSSNSLQTMEPLRYVLALASCGTMPIPFSWTDFVTTPTESTNCREYPVRAEDYELGQECGRGVSATVGFY